MRERVIALYILESTYGYADGYYADTLVQDGGEACQTTGFSEIWDAFSTFMDPLQVEVDAQQADADLHLATASEAGRRAERFTLSAVLMAVAVAVSTVALSTEFRRIRYADIAFIVALDASGLANLGLTMAA